MSLEEDLTTGKCLQFTDQRTGAQRIARGIERIWEAKTEKTVFYVEYFLTPEGQNDLAKLTGLKPEQLRFQDTEQIKTYLYRLDLTSLDAKKVEKLSKNSSNSNRAEIIDTFFLVFDSNFFLTEYGKNELKKSLQVEELELNSRSDVTEFISSLPKSQLEKLKALAKLSRNGENPEEDKFSSVQLEDEIDFSKLKEPTTVSVTHNPQVIVEQLTQYRVLKDYHRQLRRKLHGRTDPLSLAKLAVLEVHQRRLNELLAEMYGEARGLLKQDKYSGGFLRARIVEQLRGIGAGSKPLSQRTNPELQLDTRTFARIDRFLYGIGGKLVFDKPISQDSEVYKTTYDYHVLDANTVELANRSQSKTSKNNYRFQSVDPSLFNSTKVQAKIWRNWARVVLDKYGILSTDKSDNPTKIAADNKWRVLMKADKSHLRIDKKIKAIIVPEEKSFSIGSLSRGAVALQNHEISHVIQQENKEKVGLAITRRVGMDRSSMYAEAGAIACESQACEDFGLQRTVNPHYLRAIQAKLAGGNAVNCAEAYYKSMIDKDPSKKGKIGALLTAISTPRRLFRKARNYIEKEPYLTNSQPLDYIEQELLAENLREAGLSRFLLVGGVNLQMLAKLHKFGLVDLKSFNFPTELPSQILSTKIERLLLSQKANQLRR